MKACAGRVGDGDLSQKLTNLKKEAVIDQLASQYEVGPLTLKDVLDALVRPGRDPRVELDPPQLRCDVLSMEDLREGMRLKGTVRNVVDFGAFVDIRWRSRRRRR